MVEQHPKAIEAGRKLALNDVMNDPLVVFQKSAYPCFSLFMCYVFPSLVSFYLWGENMFCSFFVAGCLQHCILLHATWFVGIGVTYISDQRDVLCWE